MTDDSAERGTEALSDDPLVAKVLTALVLAAALMLGGLGTWAWVHRPRSAPDLTTGGSGAQTFRLEAPEDGPGTGGHQDGPPDPSSMNRNEKVRRLFGNM
ncbi:MAG: hypothetical protein VKO21_03565 [Candidatus Sericytochromatia bacterium]|nr:hypothetical protein [Candidatus Sericytochromatia bacterium]